MKNNKKGKILKIVLTIASIALFVGLIIYLLPTIKGIVTPDGRIVFKEKLDSMGIGKFFVMLALQLAQILLVVLPGEPLEILSGMCFGTFWGTVFILGTVFMSTALIFFLVKKYGKSYVEQFFKKEKLDKIENSKFFRDSKNIELVMTILFIIPGTPKDLLVYLGGLLPIKPLRFILISTFARFPSVISSTLMGASILKGNLKMSILIYILTFVIAMVIIFILNKFDKNKVTKDAIDAIK
ncbi:MAG: TVP38/TMEM64 family protein [Clostridia bacterium]|nr:TVP38/TMEM64 family protein [Clostridia bacterium]